MIENLTHNYKKTLLDFINNNWKKNHVFIKNEKIFDFQHKIKGGYSFLIARKGIITSILGYIYTNDSQNSFWLAIWRTIDFKSSEGIQLFFYLMKKKPDFVGAIGISKKAEEIYKRLRWKNGNLIHYYVSKINELNLRTHINKSSAHHYKYLPDFDFSKIKAPYFLPFKDTNYYNKRYLNHPEFEYFFLTLDYYNLTFIGRDIKYKGLRVFHVVDLIGDLNNKNIYGIINKFLLEEKFDLFEMMMFDSRKIKTDLLIKTKSEIIPTYFSPFKFKNISIRLSYKITRNYPVRFFLGDSDQDRPN